MDRPKIRELIDACRVPGIDLRLPEIAPLAKQLEGDPEVREIFQRAQRLDGRIARAMHEVPLPAGLCDRILMRLEAEDPTASPVTIRGRCREASTTVTSAAIQSARVESTVLEPAVAQVLNRAQPNHRQWFVGIAAVAALLLISFGLWRLYSHASPLSVNALLADSGRWHAQLLGGADWQKLAGGQTLKEFPFALAVRAMPRSWADVSPWVGRPAVAYDLNVEPGRRATLFVINEPDTSAESVPPSMPGSNTGGLAIGVWQADGLVYVLVVEGDQRRYDQLLDRTGQPLA